MKLNKVTPEEIMAWKPCEGYDLKRIKELFGRKKKANALDILTCEDISIDDRIWVVLRPEMLSIKIFQEAALAFAGHVQDLSDDKRVRECNKTTRQYLDGKATLEELHAARYAAWDATAAAERKWQLGVLINLIEQENGK